MSFDIYLGFIIGCVVMLIIIMNAPSECNRVIDIKKTKIEACEKSLPRDKSCKYIITAEIIW